MTRKKVRKLIVDKRGQDAATKVQAAIYHGTKARYRFHALKYIAVYLFAAFKGGQLRALLKTKDSAAVLFQRNLRRHFQLKKYSRIRGVVIRMQTFFRLCLAVKRYREMVAIVTRIQTFLRACYLRSRFVSMRSSALFISTYWKPRINRWIETRERAAGKKLTSIIRRKLLQTRERRFSASTLFVQRVWRGCLVRKRLGKQHRAAIKIQNMVRFDESQAEFKNRYNAAGVIRRFMLSSYRRNKEYRINSAAVKIQSIFRGALEKRRVWRFFWSALWIQKAFRGYVCRRGFHAYRGVLMLQAAYRGGKDRAHLLDMLAAAQTINDFCFEVFVERKLRAERELYSAIELQCFFRTCKAKAEVELRRTAKRSATKLQVRGGSCKEQNTKRYVNLTNIVLTPCHYSNRCFLVTVLAQDDPSRLQL